MNVIINDPGGDVSHHIVMGAFYAWSDSFLKVVYCASACLNLIAQVPKDHVCFTPSAWIGYHTAEQRLDGTESVSTMRWERGRDWIKKGYRQCE